MTLKNSDLNAVIGELSDSQLISLLDLDLKKVLWGNRETKTLAEVVKKIFIETEKEKTNKINLSHEEWQNYMFKERVEEAFLMNKSKYEKISFWYWLIPKKEEAMEYYYQLCNNETTFSELKRKHTKVRFYQNQETSKLDANLSKPLRYASLNIPVSPIRTKTGYLLLQKSDFKPAKLDTHLRKKILNKIEEEWFLREINRQIDDS